MSPFHIFCSCRSRGFFFNSARDAEKTSTDDLDVMTRMQLDYVGFWIQYEYEEGRSENHHLITST